jgi:hypothetical protein
MGVVIAVVSLCGAGVVTGVLTFLYFGTYWAKLWDEQIWDLDDENV